MFRRLGMIGAALLGAATLTSTSAQAQYYSAPGHGGGRGYYGDGYYGRPAGGYYGRGGWDRRADYRRDYHDGRRSYYGGRRHRCDRGTGGTIIGAIAGGLLGNGVAGRGDRTVGTVVGAGVGALAGRAIDRDC